jgi:hypothetical protein
MFALAGGPVSRARAVCGSCFAATPHRTCGDHSDQADLKPLRSTVGAFAAASARARSGFCAACGRRATPDTVGKPARLVSEIQKMCVDVRIFDRRLAGSLVEAVATSGSQLGYLASASLGSAS